MLILSFVFAAALTIIHLFSYKLKFLHITPRSIWLSFAGGASVSYIFVYLLPELAEGQKMINSLDHSVINAFSNHIYIISLLGLCLFYGLERYINIIKDDVKKDQSVSRISIKDFWLHILSFAFYNFLVGYLLLQRDDQNLLNITFFFIAMGFHFLVNDYGLNQHHNNLYINKGRWILSFSILLGWTVGAFTDISPYLIFSMIAFLSGGIILNVLKEELPENRKSNFWAFLAGVLLFSVVLLLV